MKRGELHHDGHVSFLTDRVVMTPKQQRVILVGDDRASGHGIICKTCKEMQRDAGIVYAEGRIVMHKPCT